MALCSLSNCSHSVSMEYSKVAFIIALHGLSARMGYSQVGEAFLLHLQWHRVDFLANPSLGRKQAAPSVSYGRLSEEIKDRSPILF